MPDKRSWSTPRTSGSSSTISRRGLAGLSVMSSLNLSFELKQLRIAFGAARSFVLSLWGSRLAFCQPENCITAAGYWQTFFYRALRPDFTGFLGLRGDGKLGRNRRSSVDDWRVSP